MLDVTFLDKTQLHVSPSISRCWDTA